MFVDLFLVGWSLWVLWQASDRSIFNPALWYVGLHVFTVTFRLIALANGALVWQFTGVRADDEFVNAAVGSDLGLLGVVAATIVAGVTVLGRRKGETRRSNPSRLSARIGLFISVFCLTVGTIALVFFSGLTQAILAGNSDSGRMRLGNIATTSYPLVLAGFAVQGALILCTIRGFSGLRLWIFVILVFASGLGLFRMDLIIPILIASLIYLTKQGMRWPPFRWLIGILILGVVWFVFKPLASAILTGATPEEVWETAWNTGADAAQGGSSEFQFFDMQASYMAASDETGVRFYGTTYVPLIYLPIPRFMWPDKPAMNQYAYDLSSTSRAFAQNGMTPNLTGESYLNFGWIGCAAIPFGYLFLMQMAYLRVRGQGTESAERWIYVLYLVFMIQVFRDGLDAVVLFGAVDFLPLLAWGVSSMVAPGPRMVVARSELGGGVAVARASARVDR